MTAAVLVNVPLPGFEANGQVVEPPRLVVVEEPPAPATAGRSLESFGLADARAVSDRWRSDLGYPLHSHLFDYLVRCEFAFSVESATDREIYNGVFDWVRSLDGGDER